MEQLIIKWITRPTFLHAHFWTLHYFNVSDAVVSIVKRRDPRSSQF